MKPVFFYTLCIITFLSCSKKSNPPLLDKVAEQKTESLTVDGNLRSFVTYLPNGYNNAGNMPLIFVLHGGGGDAQGMIMLANFKTIADREKVVLVYPEGIQNGWNDGRPTVPNQLGINDVNFFSQLCNFMISNYPVDSKKVYATGISNGGFMSSRLGCELSNKIAAIAVVAATIEATTIAASCNPNRPVPAMYIHGTLDNFAPFLGGTSTVGAGGTVLSHFQSIDKWVSLNNCSTTPTVTDLPDIANDGTTIRQRIYSNGTNGSEVVSYVVLNGGHTWPQGFQYLPESIIGKTSLDMNACEVIYSFFKRFQRL